MYSLFTSSLFRTGCLLGIIIKHFTLASLPGSDFCRCVFRSHDVGVLMLLKLCYFPRLLNVGLSFTMRTTAAMHSLISIGPHNHIVRVPITCTRMYPTSVYRVHIYMIHSYTGVHNTCLRVTSQTKSPSLLTTILSLSPLLQQCLNLIYFNLSWMSSMSVHVKPSLHLFTRGSYTQPSSHSVA